MKWLRTLLPSKDLSDDNKTNQQNNIHTDDLVNNNAWELAKIITEKSLFLIDNKSRVIDTNYTAKNNFSTDNFEIIGQNLHEVFQNLNICTDTIPNKIFNDFTDILHSKKDDEKYRIHFLDISRGKELYFIVSVSEIINKKKPLTQNKENEVNKTSFQDAFDNLMIGIYRTSIKGEILAANKHLIKLLEYENLEELQKQNLENHSQIGVYNRRIFLFEIEKTGEVVDLIAEWTTKTGKIITVKENARAVYDSNSNFLYYEGIVEDISEKKKVEYELEQNENRLNNAQKMARVGSWSYNYINDTFLWSNEAYSLFGYSDGEISPTYGFFLNQIYEDDKSSFISALENHLIKKAPFDIEVRFKRKDGTLFYSHAIGKSYYNLSGELTQFEGTFQNIDERKETEELLKRSLEKLALHIENTPLAYIEWNENMEVVNWNKSATEIFGYSKFEAKGKKATDLIVPDKDRDKVQEILHNLENSKGGQYEKMINIKKDGTELICEWYNTLIRNKKSSIIISMILDITEKTEAEKQLIKEKNKAEEFQKNFHLLSETALDFLRITKIEDFYKYIVKKLFSIKLNVEFILFLSFNSKSGILKTEHIEGEEKIIAKLKKMLGSNPLDIVLQTEPKDIKKLQTGKIHTLEQHISRLNLGNVNLLSLDNIKKKYDINHVSFIGIARDDEVYGSICFISKGEFSNTNINLIESIIHQSSIAYHRLSIERELIIAKDRAQESDKLKSAFLANMSHEIRTPMNGILGFAQLLRNPNLQNEKRDLYINVINENSKYLLSLVNDIVDISKIQANQLSISEINFNLNRLLKDVYEFFNLDLKTKDKTSVTLDLSCYLPDNKSDIFADQLRIQQILNNLLSNAIKFTSHGFINFGYELQNNDTLKFYVKDSGIGLAKNKVKIIFERFTQADHSTTRKYGGTGLGLAICKGLVNLMKGKIWVESLENEGSQFYFEIPYKSNKDEAVEPIEQRDKITLKNNQLENKNILIVEDDVISYTYLKELLEEYNIKIMHAWDGEEAINFCRKNSHIDLILMDIHLPKINGYEATKKILKINNKIPIIAQTAYAMVEDKKKCMEIGCVDYLTKPVEKDVLFDSIKKYALTFDENKKG